jgi:hypothetical protein
MLLVKALGYLCQHFNMNLQKDKQIGYKGSVVNPLKTQGILRKFQKVIQLTQKWMDLKNGTA